MTKTLLAIYSRPHFLTSSGHPYIGWITTVVLPMPRGHFRVSHINNTGLVLRDQFQVKPVHQRLDAWIPGNYHPEDGRL